MAGVGLLILDYCCKNVGRQVDLERVKERNATIFCLYFTSYNKKVMAPGSQNGCLSL